MKRWLAWLTIGSYVSALAFGLVCHAMNFALSSHPAMYYVVWDMFCGWSAHELRYHLVGEGESGNYYHLAPAPWNTFAPYGDLDRNQYDSTGNAHAAIALNTLRHTDHEPISRIYLIEEAWPKKFNLPDHLWAVRFDEPKEPHSYFWLKRIYDGEGRVIESKHDYITELTLQSVLDNPRLKEDSRRGKPFYAVDPSLRNHSMAVGAGAAESTAYPWSHPSAN